MSKLLSALAIVGLTFTSEAFAYKSDFEVICPCKVTAISDTAINVTFKVANQGNVSGTEYVQVEVLGSDERGGSFARSITHSVSAPVPSMVGDLDTYELTLPLRGPSEGSPYPYLVVSGGTLYGRYFLEDFIAPTKSSGYSFGQVVQSRWTVVEVMGQRVSLQLPPLENLTESVLENIGWRIDLLNPEEGSYYQLANTQLGESLAAYGQSSPAEFDLDVDLDRFPDTHRTLRVTGYSEDENGYKTTLLYDDLYNFSDSTLDLSLSYDSAAIDFFVDSDDDGFSDYLEASLGQRDSVDSVSPAEIVLTFMATTEAIEASDDIDAELDHLIAHSNNILEASGVRAKYLLNKWIDIGLQNENRLSCDDETEEAEPEKCNLWSLARNLEEPFEEGLELESDGRTDVIVAYAKYIEGTDVCGIASTVPQDVNEFRSGPTRRQNRLNIVSLSQRCGAQTLTHEVGHIAGLGHSRPQLDNYPFGMTSYATGHGVEARFATVMAYGSAFSAARVDLFSSPLGGVDGYPAGVDRSNIFEGADATFVLNQTLPRISATSGGYPPVIEIDGARVVSILLGAPPFSEPGFSASDVEDGDLSNQVNVRITNNDDEIISLPSDTSAVQTFYLKYSVIDSDQNRAEIIRTVIIEQDLDNDGIPDSQDDDRDGDGVANDLDIFPNDANETYDSDGDGVGDNGDDTYDPSDTAYFYFANANDTCADEDKTWLELDIDGVRSRELLPGEALAVKLAYGNHVIRSRDKFGGVTSQVYSIPSQATKLVGCDLTSFDWDDYDILWDSDGDLVPDREDDYPSDRARSLMPDGDGDGVKDDYDLFPNNPNEWFDSDADGLGDNADTVYDPAELVELSFVNRTDACSSPEAVVFELDGVETPEIAPGTKFVTPVAVGKHLLYTYKAGMIVSGGIIDIYSGTTLRGWGCDWGSYNPDAYTPIVDSDGDLVGDTADAFPLNRNESIDTDGDGIGNNADTDDDGDGYTDEQEIIAGSNPLDSSSKPEDESTGLPIWMFLLTTEPRS
jgi:hypothetical protein